jgi:hypothetical protein
MTGPGGLRGLRAPAAVARAQQRLRDRAEAQLRLAAMDDLRRAHPRMTTAPHRPPGGAFWRHVFVPLYRRVPWEAKQRAMRALRMTADRHGWTPPARRPGEPWRPPPAAADRDGGAPTAPAGPAGRP